MALSQLACIVVLSLVSGGEALQVRMWWCDRWHYQASLQCYECNGITASDGLCEGTGNVGNKVSWLLGLSWHQELALVCCTQVECGQYCGLMKMEILHYDRHHSTVVSTDSRWRRGCTTNGSELTRDSEMAGKTVSGLGCEKLGDRSEDRKKIVSFHITSQLTTPERCYFIKLIFQTHTVCVCNSTLCNERNSGWALSVPLGVKIILTLCLALSLNNNY